jgi:hypothetical protein
MHRIGKKDCTHYRAWCMVIKTIQSARSYQFSIAYFVHCKKRTMFLQRIISFQTIPKRKREETAADRDLKADRDVCDIIFFVPIVRSSVLSLIAPNFSAALTPEPTPKTETQTDIESG